MSKDTNTKQILLPVDFPASHSASQEKEKEQMTIDTSGMKLLESLENVNLDGSLAKMLKVLLTSTTAWYSDRCKLTWKKKVSKSNVLLFQLQASVLGIKGKESGLWLTPTATDISTRSQEAMERRKKYRTSIGRTTVPPGNLAEQVQYGIPTVNMYPTPTAGCVEGGEQSSRVEMTESGGFILRKKNKPEMTFGAKLSDAMIYLSKMYPTPRASAAMTEDMETIAKRNKYNSKLEEKVALQMYPTPTTDSTSERTKKYKQGGTPLPLAVQMEQKKPGGKLNPEFVEFLMGYPLNWTKIDPTE